MTVAPGGEFDAASARRRFSAPSPANPGPSEPGHGDLADDGLNDALVAGLRPAAGDTGRIDDRPGTPLSAGTQIEVVLEQLAEQITALLAEPGLELVVAEAFDLDAREELHDSATPRAPRSALSPQTLHQLTETRVALRFETLADLPIERRRRPDRLDQLLGQAHLPRRG